MECILAKRASVVRHTDDRLSSKVNNALVIRPAKDPGEGYGLQAVHNCSAMNPALAAEGGLLPGLRGKIPQGLKPKYSGWFMYGLKPVPFTRFPARQDS